MGHPNVNQYQGGERSADTAVCRERSGKATVSMDAASFPPRALGGDCSGGTIRRRRHELHDPQHPVIPRWRRFFSRQKRETSVATILGLSAPPKPKYGRLVRACFRRPTSLRSACVGLPQLAFMRLLNFRVRTICAQKQRANQGGLIGSHASGLHP